MLAVCFLTGVELFVDVAVPWQADVPWRADVEEVRSDWLQSGFI